MQKFLFKVAVLRIHYRVKEFWQSPEFMGARLRGMFGHALKAQSGETTEDSVYFHVFDSRREANQDYPANYLLRPPALGVKNYVANQIFCFEQVLWGRALDFLPEVFQAWQQARFEESTADISLEKIEVLNHERQVIGLLNGSEMPNNTIFAVPNICSEEQDRIKLQFDTPLYFRERGRDVRTKELKAKHIAMAAIRRGRLVDPNVLQEAQLPPPVMQAWAESLEIRKKLNWFEQRRWSNKQNKSLRVAGLLGEVELIGNLQPFMPALQLLPYIGLGKSANFGLGNISIKS